MSRFLPTCPIYLGRCLSQQRHRSVAYNIPHPAPSWHHYSCILYLTLSKSLHEQHTITQSRSLLSILFIKPSDMTISSRLILTATALLWTAQTGSAVPRPSPNVIANLFKRADVQFQDCGGDDDPKRQTAGRAWSEAANLAEFTIDGTLDDLTQFQGTNA